MNYRKSSLLASLAALCLALGGPQPAGAQAPTTQRFTVPINGAKISYTVTGNSGPVLLLIHGYPLNGDLFERQRAAFSSSYRVITVDLRGFGHSTAPNEYANIKMYAEDTLALMSQLGITQAIIGGHSMGAAVATEMYRLDPSLFLGMILNDPAVPQPTLIEQNFWIGFEQQSQALGGSSLPATLLPNFLTGETRTNQPAIVNTVTKQILSASLHALVGGANALEVRPDFSTLLPTISVPVLLLYGEDDPLTPIEQGQTLQAAIPNAQLVVVPHASHALVRERPAAANQAIANWLLANFGTSGYNPSVDTDDSSAKD